MSSDLTVTHVLDCQGAGRQLVFYRSTQARRMSPPVT
jgi:hypothetical protein